MIEYDSPFEPRSPAKLPAAKTLAEAALFDSTSSGTPAKRRGPLKANATQQRRQRQIETDQEDATTLRLLYALEERGLDPEATLRHLLERALRAPSERNMERMRAAANEVGRIKGGGAALARVVDQEVAQAVLDASQAR